MTPPPMIRRMWLHAVPEDLFGNWSGEIVIDAPGVAPRRVLFSGNLETWFSTGPVEPRRAPFVWRRCGAALGREIATRICKVRLASWADMEEDDD